MKKIWIIDHYSSEPKYGGISRQYDFCHSLSKRGYQVTVIASSFSHFSHNYFCNDKVNYSCFDNNAAYVYLKTKPYKTNKSLNRIMSMFSFVKAVKSHYKEIAAKFGKPDIVVGCSIHPFAWKAAHFISKKYNARFFAEVRDLWPASQIYNLGMSKYNPKLWYLGKLEKWAFDRAEKIIYSMSRGDKYICDILGYSKQKVMWIDQPMDCERFDRNAQRYDELPQEIRDFIGDSFLCVFTGYYMPYEGVMEMIEAANITNEKKLPIKYLFLGSGNEESKMKQYVEDNNLSNVFVGNRINKELIPAVLRRANICLAHLAIKGNPNSFKFDASKNKINEYMYSNSCIIYGTYIENHFVKTSGSGITIEPYNAAAFATTIEKVFLLSEEDKANFGQNAKTYIFENNTLEKLTEKYIALIGE